MNKPFYKKWWFILIITFIVIGAIGTTMIGDDQKTSEKELKEKNDTIVIDMKAANDTSIPLEERIAKIATDLFGTTTTDGRDRDIRVESMGDTYYLKLMIDNSITKKKKLNDAQQNTVKLLKILKDVEDMGNIHINWQDHFKDDYGNPTTGSAITTVIKKTDMDKIDLANFQASDLKKIASYYYST